MFDHFVGLVLKGLTITTQDEDYKTLVVLKAFLNIQHKLVLNFFEIFSHVLWKLWLPFYFGELKYLF